MLLEGKNAIVTGGSRGIGKAVVEAFLKQGASVYYISRSEGESLDNYKKLAEEHGGTVAFRKADVSNEEEITEVINSILKEAGTIDILVNNAGITKDGLVFRMSSEDWNKVLSVNLSSAFFVSKIVARSMAKQRSGSIINISSIVGVIGNAGQCNYAASKAGLIGFSKSLAREVAARGVRVNTIAPGFIETDMTDKLKDNIKENLLSQIPMNRLGQPEEVANIALFLATGLSSYITGQVLLVDGGMGM